MVLFIMKRKRCYMRLKFPKYEKFVLFSLAAIHYFMHNFFDKSFDMSLTLVHTFSLVLKNLTCHIFLVLYTRDRKLQLNDLKYSNHYSFLMLDSSCMRFAIEVEYGNSYHYTNIDSC